MLCHKFALPPKFGKKILGAFGWRHSKNIPSTFQWVKDPYPTSETQTIEKSIAENKLIPNTTNKGQTILVINSNPLCCPGMASANSNNCTPGKLEVEDLPVFVGF